MYLFILHLAVQNLERIQMDALMEGENGVADGGVVSQAEVFLRGPRWRGGMTVPVGENLQTFASSIFQCCELILGCKGEMLGGVVDVLHPVVLSHHVSLI